jgi:hypothetical protein
MTEQLPEPVFMGIRDFDPVFGFTTDQMHQYASTENAALRVDLALAMRHFALEEKNSEHWHKKYAALQSQVRELRDALQRVFSDKSFNCLKIEKTQDFVRTALEISLE